MIMLSLISAILIVAIAFMWFIQTPSGVLLHDKRPASLHEALEDLKAARRLPEEDPE